MIKATLHWLYRNYPGDLRILRRIKHRLTGGALAPSVQTAIDEINDFQGGTSSDSDEMPIIILSAGWRSGSTLLQRLVVSSGEALIWGEPFGAASVCHFMSESLRRIPAQLTEDRILDESPEFDKLAGQWIANLYPPTKHLLAAHLQFWNSLLAEPARAHGFKRWGFKDIRLTIDHAHYLKWLYPNARFILLHRNPYDAYLSYRKVGYTWYETWPENPITSASDFGRHWNKLASGYLDHAAEIGALIIRFEDLVADKAVVRQISDFLELELDALTLDKRVGSTSKESYTLSALEIESLRRATAPTADRLGYEVPSSR